MVLLCAAGFGGNAGACADIKKVLRAGPTANVTRVQDGNTVFLDNGMQVRLMGIQAPKRADEGQVFDNWPLAEDARLALEQMSLGKKISLWFGSAKSDRHNRLLAHMIIEPEANAEPIWAQGALLSQGMARVYSFADNRVCIDALYALERQARIDKLGIWQNAFYDVRQADKPARLIGRAGFYELVEGRVLNADLVGSRLYLNFGKFWKEDFTVVIERQALQMFKATQIDPLGLQGALVRVRGWLDNHDGPRLEITHPEQLEILAKP